MESSNREPTPERRSSIHEYCASGRSMPCRIALCFLWVGSLYDRVSGLEFFVPRRGITAATSSPAPSICTSSTSSRRRGGASISFPFHFLPVLDVLRHRFTRKSVQTRPSGLAKSARSDVTGPPCRLLLLGSRGCRFECRAYCLFRTERAIG